MPIIMFLLIWKPARYLRGVINWKEDGQWEIVVEGGE
jgi:hypothetical protein